MAEKSAWPTVEEQLKAAKAPSGSALEKLIVENQDFHLLEPEEAQDRYELPVWLRVYWRKNHPDVQHPKINPGAGYPDVLHSVYKWMLAHPEDPTRKGGK